MNEVMPLSKEGGYDLGQWLGRRQAFNLVAGRCSAADAECIRQIREKKLYRSRAGDWTEFCEMQLHMSRSNADRLIRLLERFGPEYFHISQITRISPDQYRAIAPAITDGCIVVDGETIPLTTENSERVAAAVATLREAARPVSAALPPSARERISTIEADCRRVLQAFRDARKECGGSDPYLVSALERLADEAARLALEAGGNA